MIKHKLIIIGAPKSGTTSLANWLAPHPSFLLPKNKEPRFYTDFGEINWSGPNSDIFSSTLVTDPLVYEKLYQDNGEATWGIDASTDYLWCKTSAQLIKEASTHIPTKIIAILREPVARAFSEYSHTIRDRLQSHSFIESLNLEKKRREQHWPPLFYHQLRSSYAEQIGRYLDIFDDTELLLLTFNELKRQDETLRRVFKFLESDEQLPIKDSVYNSSFKYKSPALDKFLHSDNFIKTITRCLLPKKARNQLYKQLSSANKNAIKITDTEWHYANNLLDEEIKRCRRELPIDTHDWGR